MFVRNKSLDTILASFNRTMSDLDTFSAAARNESDSLRVSAEKMIADAETKTAEANKAEQVRANLAALLG